MLESYSNRARIAIVIGPLLNAEKNAVCFDLYDASGGVAVLGVGGGGAAGAGRQVDDSVDAQRRDPSELVVRQRRGSDTGQRSGHIVEVQLILTSTCQYHVRRLQQSIVASV